MNQPRTGLRYEYREQEAQRINSSPTLAARFPELKTLTLDLGYYNAEGISKNSQIKCVPNLANAKAVYRVDCPNRGCIGGDFDLTKELAAAVAERQTSVSAEMSCQGWQSKTTVDTVHCHNILRYKLSLAY